MSREALLQADSRTREVAVREFSRPLMVEAGAGTGKTALLVARILAWSLGPGWERAVGEGAREVAGKVASGVVAITFTEKAAAEMAARLGQQLTRLAAGQEVQGLPQVVLPGEKTRERALALLRVLDRFTLCTIHAFCRRLLATYPLEAGVHPEATVDASGLETAAAVEQVVTAFLAAPPEELRASWAEVTGRGVGSEELVALLEALVAQSVVPEDLERFPLEQNAQELKAELQAAAASLAQLLQGLPAASKRVGKAEEVRAFVAGLAASQGDPALFLQRFAKSFRQAKNSHLDRKLADWGRGKLSQEEQRFLGTHAAQLGETSGRFLSLARFASQCDVFLLRALLPVAATLLGQLRRLLAEKNLLTFQDLLVKAVALLEHHPAIRERERTRIQQLLVDEFQDTDRWQARLVELLALDGQGPGLFVVGDPKQSIYGWRSADLAMYEAFKEKVQAVGGEVLPLVLNFRSVPAVLQEVERVVAPVMVYERGVQPAFAPLVAHRSDLAPELVAPPGHAPVEYWVSWEADGEGRKTGAGTAREIEAWALAGHMRELHEQHGVPYSDMALLLRALSDVHVYLEAFRRYDVPTVVHREPTYFQRREVMDAACFFRAVIDPGDEIALVGFLRSPWAGIPDAAWWPLKKRGFFPKVSKLRGQQKDLVEELRAMLREVAGELAGRVPGIKRIRHWEEAAAWALAVLGWARESLDRLPLDEFVYEVRRLLLMDATEAARFPGRVRVENLERFFRLLLQELGEKAQEPGALLLAIRRAMERSRELPLGKPPEAEDAVLVTSIHQAKGLDFRYVFCADTHRESRGSNHGTGVFWLQREEHRELVFQVGGFVSPNGEKLRSWQQRVAQAELVRLLYVALTRAKDRLVVCGNWGSPGQDSLAGLIARRREAKSLEEDLRSLPPGQDRVAADGVLWVFPARRKLETPRATKVRHGLPEWTVIAQQAAQLQQAREQARIRQALALLAPASGEAHRLLAESLAGTEGEPHLPTEVGALVGTAVHRVLERWPWGKPAPEALEVTLASLETLVPELQEEPAAAAAAKELLQRFAASPLFPGFLALGGKVVAQELPFLLAPENGESAGALAGSMDLVFREGERLVVVDFKTDRVEGEELRQRAAIYQAQGRVYCRGLRDALQLSYLPPFELWFLWPSVRLRVEWEGTSGQVSAILEV